MVTIASLPVNVDARAIDAFCERWKVTELAVFGSALREDFGPKSDIDLLITFRDDARPGLFALAEMEEELCAIFGREIDLVTRRSVDESPNWIPRRAILETAMPLDTQPTSFSDAAG